MFMLFFLTNMFELYDLKIKIRDLLKSVWVFKHFILYDKGAQIAIKTVHEINIEF